MSLTSHASTLQPSAEMKPETQSRTLQQLMLRDGVVLMARKLRISVLWSCVL